MGHQTRILIVGQGLAGSLLAYSLLNEGFDVHILNAENKPSATKVSAGLIQPVTGKFLTQNPFITPYYSETVAFYKTLEEVLTCKFLRHIPTHRILNKMQQKIFKKKSKHDAFKKLFSYPKNLHSNFGPDHSQVLINDSYVINVDIFLSAFLIKKVSNSLSFLNQF